MPRGARLLIDGGTYHILTRGNNGQPVFHHEIDYQRYLQLLSASAKEQALKVYHFSLMPNHVHLVLEAAFGRKLSKAMLSVNLAYALFYQKRYRYAGHLWQGRFKSLLIDHDRYLLSCGRYVELNPVRAGLVKSPGEYPWTSFRAYAQGEDNPLLAPHPLYETFGTSSTERQNRYRRFILEGLSDRLRSSDLRLDGRPEVDPPSTEAPEAAFTFRFHNARRGRPKKQSKSGDASISQSGDASASRLFKPRKNRSASGSGEKIKTSPFFSSQR